MRCEGRNCAGVVQFELGKGFEIALCRGIVVFINSERLESTKSVRPASQHQVTRRTASKIFYFFREDCADANAGAELFVGGLQPRCSVNCVAISSVVEEAAAPEISDDRRPCMDANTSDSQCDTFFLPARAE